MSELIVTRAVRVASLERLPPARKRALFSRRERSLASRKPRGNESLAARLAVKLGFLFLLRSAGFAEPVSPSKIEVLNQRNGKPRLFIGERGSRAYLRARRARILLSIAHTRSWGVATLAIQFL